MAGKQAAKAKEEPKLEDNLELPVTVDEPIDVEIDDSEPEVDEPKVVVAKEDPAKEKPEDEDEIVTRLQAQLDEANRIKQAEIDARQREIAARQKAEADLKSYRTQAQDAQTGQYDAAIEMANTQKSIAKREYAQALANGDYDAAAEAQDRMATLASQLGRLEEGRELLEARKAEPVPQTPPDLSGDPVELVIRANPGLPSDEAAWIRAHPDAVTDASKFQRLGSVAGFAATKFARGSKEYYSFIEDELGYSKPEEKAPVKETKTPKPSYAAPVSREGGGGGLNATARGSKIRLTPAQVEAANISGQTPEQYAKNLVRLGKDDPAIAATIQYVN